MPALIIRWGHTWPAGLGDQFQHRFRESLGNTRFYSLVLSSSSKERSGWGG